MKNQNKRNETQTTHQVEVEGMATLSKLGKKEAKKEVVNIDKQQLRFLVDSYYQAQSDRIVKENQSRAIAQGYDDNEDHSTFAIDLLRDQYKENEKLLKDLLEAYVDADPVGKWIKANTGVGPIFAAVFLAYFDIEKCQYAGQFLSYAGLNDHNNPWLGKEKSSAITNIVFQIHDLNMSIRKKIFQEMLDSKAYSYLEENIKRVYKFASKPEDVGYIISSVVQSDVLDYHNDGIDESEIKVIDRLMDVKNDILYLLSEYQEYVYKYEKEYSEKLEFILNGMISSYQIDINDKECSNILVNLPDRSKLVVLYDSVLPTYLKYMYDYLNGAKIQTVLDVAGLTDFFIYIGSKTAVSPEVIDITAIVTDRNIPIIEKGLKSLKKKDKKDSKKSPYTKTDLINYLSKPPYNADLKTRCYLLGESFCKVSGKEKSLYGRLYRERKAYEIKNNSKYLYADQALAQLTSKNYDKNTSAYKSYIEGQLPDGHISQRAKRFAVKIFLVHLFECMYMNYYHKAPPVYYPLEHLGHFDYIKPEVPYEEYIDVPKEYYEQYGKFNQIDSTAKIYGV